jgi:DNA mismatch repair protein MutS
MSEMAKQTPMMVQYNRIKREHHDSILLFRLGDFYEMFEKDAVYASRALNITLTKRNDIPMCGFPFHAADTYIARLLGRGNRIAICEQTEDPGLAKGIVRREVVEIISPGIITDPDLLSNNSTNCIAALRGREEKGRGGLFLACASLDVSTGYFASSIIDGGDAVDHLLNEIEDNGIRELIYPESLEAGRPLHQVIDRAKKLRSDVVFRPLEEHLFNRSDAEHALSIHFSVKSTDVFELRHDLEVVACGALLAYAKANVKRELAHVQWVRGIHRERSLFIDNATKKHLELTQNQSDSSSTGTLLSILDRTETSMGGRGLRKTLNSPFGDAALILQRQGQVAYLHEHADLVGNLGASLSRILDIERIISKLSVGKGNARDIVGLKNSLRASGELKNALHGMGDELFGEEILSLGDFSDLIDLMERAVEDDPPMSVQEGRFIRAGFNEELDTLRSLNRENREWINRYQREEQERLGIGSLKVRYNRIIGYYIEVTKPNLHLVSANYIKKQTLVNSERFTTEELERHEAALMEARERSNRLEIEIFEEICREVLLHMETLFDTARAVARVDVCRSLAVAAREHGYVRPMILEENIIEIADGRHPVVEVLGEETFIANDLHLNDDERRIMILTGPNMAGKSTYLRQCALIVIMAHMGSFVPAGEARIGLVDRVFSRIGASDRLIRGESTFLVEMIETSRILHYATDRSFVIMARVSSRRKERREGAVRDPLSRDNGTS